MLNAILVDDDAVRVSFVRAALTQVGCTQVAYGTLADVLAATSGIAIVAMGLDVLARLPDLARCEIPLVVLCDERSIDAVLAAGLTACLARPLRTKELVGRLRAAIGDRDRTHRERHKSDTIEALRREKEDLQRLVCVDALTGVANRRHALALLDAEWRRSMREHVPIGVVMLDLDCYHQYNEHYGHLGGDTCLQLVSEALVRSLRRPSDYLGRYGGEEFIAVLPNTDAVGAKLVAERMRANVEALAIPHEASACARVVTITAGFASLHVTPDLAAERLIGSADQALLVAKTQGRNRIGGEAPLVRPSNISAARWLRWEPVHADPWFADRIPAFLSTVHHAARALHFDPALRTTARELGLPIVERLLGDLAHAADPAPIADELVQYVTHVQVIYRRPSELVKPALVPAPGA